MDEPTRPDAPKGGAEENDRSPETRVDAPRERLGNDATIPDAPAPRSSGAEDQIVDTSREAAEIRAPGYDDLSDDSLLRGLPRVQVAGHNVPSLGGIQIARKLGQGAMGAVYLGFKPMLRQFVAVKVLPMHLAQLRPELVDRFLREAQLAASIESPNLIRVTDVDESEGLFFLVMEYVDGVSAGALLRSLRNSGELLDEATALDICIAAGSGLAAAHARGIIHRDLKPDNILLPRPDPQAAPAFSRAKLADLGLARSDVLGHSLTSTDTGMGTAGYMAPEQATSARTAGKPADVFGLGATLYALLAVRPPFIGDSTAGIIVKTIQEPHTPLQELRGDVSEPTAALIDRCLAKDPAQRFIDASALVDGLRACRDALGGSGSAATAIARLEALSHSTEVGERLRPPSSPSTEADRKALTVPDSPAPSTLIQSATTQAQKAVTLADPAPTLLQGVPPAGSARNRRIAIVTVILLALVATAFAVWQARKAPAAGSSTAAIAPMTIDLITSADRADWVQWAVDEFARTPSGRDTRFSVKTMHGLEVEARMLDGRETPMVVLMTNDLTLERFSAAWSAKHGRDPFARREIVALSPQVFVIFEDRYVVFEKHYRKLNFTNLGDALTRRRWTAIGGPEAWGPITFALSDRTESLNGLATATLAVYEATGHDELLTLEEAVSPKARQLLAKLDQAFRSASGGHDIMEELAIKGPSRFDGVFTDETSAIEFLESAEDRWGPVRIAYPEVNLWNESTVYLVNDPKASEDARAAGNAFIDFLLGDVAQRQLVTLGNRPVNPTVRLHAPDSPFVRLEGKGVRLDVPLVLAKPSAEVIAELARR